MIGILACRWYIDEEIVGAVALNYVTFSCYPTPPPAGSRLAFLAVRFPALFLLLSSPDLWFQNDENIGSPFLMYLLDVGML
jgi:hypothetical protein